MITAPGKLLLFGEHAAVFGYPAVGIALDRTLRVTSEPARAFQIELPGNVLDDTTMDTFVRHIREVSNTFPETDIMPQRLTITSDIPLGSGFGSSAALCTALARWLTGDEIDAYRIWEIAHHLETFFHGTPSGIDTGLTSLGGFRYFEFAGVAPGHLPTSGPLTLPEATLIVGSIPRIATTHQLVADVRQRRQAAPDRYDAVLHRLGALAEDMISEGTSASAGPSKPGNTDTSIVDFGKRANEGHQLLTELGVSTPELDTVLDAGRAAGALGGKVSGAGGGGAFYLVGTETRAQRILQAVQGALPGGGSAFIISLLRDKKMEPSISEGLHRNTSSSRQIKDQDQTAGTIGDP